MSANNKIYRSIVSGVGASLPKEIVTNKENGYLVEDIKEENMYILIKNLINDDKYFEEVMTKCMQKSKEYHWEKTTDSLLRLYQEAKFSLKN